MTIAPTIFVWLILAAAIVLAFARNYSASGIVLIIALFSAIYTEHLTWLSVSSILLGFFVAYCAKKAHGKSRVVAFVILIPWAIAMAAHLAPGFNNLQVLDQVIAGKDSIPFNMFLNLDKPMVFFALAHCDPEPIWHCKTY